MRHRRNVADAAHLDARSGECADRGLTAGAGAGDAHIDRTQTVVASCIGCTDRRLLRRKRGSLAGAAEAERAGGLPAERVALLVGDGDDGVVEARLDENEPKWNVLPFPLLELLVLARVLAPAALFCVFAMGYFVAFFLPATVPLRGPLRVRALVWVRWPRTGSERRWRRPR